MQRTKTAVSIAFVLTLFLSGETRVFAATPTPAPTGSTQTVPEGIKIPNAINNVKMESEQGPDSEPTPGSQYGYTVKGTSVNTSDFKIPKLDDISKWLMNVIPYMSAKQINDNIKPRTNNLYISGQARRCIYLSNSTIPIDEKIGDTYKTELIEYLPSLVTAGELLSAQQVRNIVSLSQNNGKYDFSGPAYEVLEAPECPEPGDMGTPQEPIQVTIVKPFSILEWFESFIDKIKIKRVLVSNQLTPEMDRIGCIVKGNGCVNDGTAQLDYLGNKNKQDAIKNSGGIVDTFRTDSMDTSKGESSHGQEENFTQTNTKYTKEVENSANLIMCSLVPKEKRGAVGLTDADCEGFISEEKTDCEIDESLLTENSECQLKNNTLGLPDNLIRAINAAAYAFKVPPSLIVGIIYGEGGFNPGSMFLNESDVETYLDGCASLPNCSPGGSEIKNIVSYSQSYWSEVGDAIKVLYPDREPNPCNLLDGIFALTKDLMQNQIGSPSFSGQKCFGINLVPGKAKLSPSCSWSDSAAETAIRVWEFGTGYTPTASCATKANSCLLGGGYAAQCPTGNDTCETIGNRYTQKSHNGCVWDIYKSN
jgi:hypothetical protein